MMKAGIDQDALITMFAEASAKQGNALRKGVSEATLRALQGRELTLDNIKKVVKNVAEAASTGIARNPAPAVDIEGLLGKALGGIDAALLQAVEANRKALEQFVSGGVSLSEKPLKEALANIEKMEDVFFGAITKASQSAGPLQGPWQGALDAMKMKGSATGAQATQTVESACGPGADRAAPRPGDQHARGAGDARQLRGDCERRSHRHVGRAAGRHQERRRRRSGCRRRLGRERRDRGTQGTRAQGSGAQARALINPGRGPEFPPRRRR